jgi:hypothetical protein
VEGICLSKHHHDHAGSSSPSERGQMQRNFSAKEINFNNISNKDMNINKDEISIDESDYRADNDIQPFAGELFFCFALLSFIVHFVQFFI